MTYALHSRARWARLLTEAGFAALVLSATAVTARAQAPVPATAAPPLSRDWKQLAMPGFMVVGDAEPGDLRRAGEQILRFRDAVRTLRPGIRLDPDTPTFVVVFRHDGVMRPFKPRRRDGSIIDSLSAYTILGDVIYLTVTADTSRAGDSGLFDVYAVHLLRQNLRRVPFWLSQGLVDFYASFETRDRDGRTIVGAPVKRHVQTLARLTPVPLAQLTATEGSAPVRRDSDEIYRFTATAWALIHYLLVGKEGAMRPLLLDFIDAVEAGEPSGSAFTRIFGSDLAPLEKAVRQHIAQLKLPALVLVAARSQAPEAAPMREADAQQIRAGLLVGLGQPELAEPYVERALAADPAHVGARVTRARALTQQHKPAEALAALADLGPDAAGRFDVLMARASALRDAERYAEAVTAYRQAAALRPDEPSVHYQLSLAHMGAGDPEAIAAFTRCLTLRPDAEWFALRQRYALGVGVDTYLASDAINWVRRQGWPDDQSTSYVMLIKAFTERRQKKDADAEATLTEIAAHHKAGDWVLTLVAFWRGEIAADALVARAGDDGQRTEAHAYAGIKASIDGDRDTARRHLEWVKTSGRREYFEHGYALGELRRLDKAR